MQTSPVLSTEHLVHKLLMVIKNVFVNFIKIPALLIRLCYKQSLHNYFSHLTSFVLCKHVFSFHLKLLKLFYICKNDLIY